MVVGARSVALGLQTGAGDTGMPGRPAKPIRRFDVFAEYRKQDEQANGMPADQAKGYGLWVAKLVAARKFGRLRARDQSSADRTMPRQRRKWHTLDGQPQTDELFEHEIVERMGKTFYYRVFAPAIRRARRDGQSYEAIRDRIRRGWKPRPRAAANA
jgi:hypothetical protein